MVGCGECSVALQQPTPACKQKTPTGKRIWVNRSRLNENMSWTYKGNVADEAEEGKKTHNV